MKKILLIDGNNFFTRGHFIAKSKCEDSVKFVLDMTISLKERYSNARFIFAFDTTKSHRRLAIYPEYKGNRKSSMTEQEYTQLKNSLNQYIDIIKTCGLTVLDGEGYEADDYIACISQMLKMRNDVLIVSTDGDLLQMVDEYVKVFDPIKRIVVTKDNFEKIFELPLKFFTDYKIIKGDESDNIPGVDNVGVVRSKKMLLKYGKIKEIYESLKKQTKLNESEKSFVASFESGRLELNRQLMDLRLCLLDTKLQEHIKNKVANTKKLDQDTLLRLLAVNNCTEILTPLSKLCLVS